MALEIIQEYVSQILCSKNGKYNYHVSKLIYYTLHEKVAAGAHLP